MDAAYVYDVARALEQPESLDQPQSFVSNDSFLEIHEAAFGAGDTLVMTCSGIDEDALPSGMKWTGEGDDVGLGVYSLTERRFLSMIRDSSHSTGHR
ncbi:hypothetical protein ATI61_11553 [Archangium gephyra]|uniref:Uncharacterized protein n=1 Tax=Archangium gephyra TaxID=48 RepID=A0AAC8Q9Z3_9BACT|nr:hypothetical protein [Archangium gephyra]AKJ03479.1 Hypothetical protein AA314_05105 [Archangium gephyra]REG24014.1 hypothetical protein ATI61_11553 [Archangium gephyra]